MRELALLLPDGTLIHDKGWLCIADVMGSFHGFDVRLVYGVIVDGATLVQVYPPLQLMDGTATAKP